MPLEFPVVRTVFADLLKVREARFWREDFLQTSGTQRGDVLTAEVAFPKWQANVSLAPMTFDEAAEAQAMIEAIMPHEQFHLYNPMKPYPKSDPDGSILGSATPEIHTIGSDNKSLRISGLPAAYVLSAGDFLTYSFGSNPVRRILCRIVETVTASGVGLSPLFAVSTPLRSGTITGLSVVLKRPYAKMMFAPGSFDPGTGQVDRLTTGMSFSAIEAY